MLRIPFIELLDAEQIGVQVRRNLQQPQSAWLVLARGRVLLSRARHKLLQTRSNAVFHRARRAKPNGHFHAIHGRQAVVHRHLGFDAAHELPQLVVCVLVLIAIL